MTFTNEELDFIETCSPNEITGQTIRELVWGYKRMLEQQAALATRPAVPSDAEIFKAAQISTKANTTYRSFLAGVRWLLDWQASRQPSPQPDTEPLVEAIKTALFCKVSGSMPAAAGQWWKPLEEALAAYEAQQKGGA